VNSRSKTSLAQKLIDNKAYRDAYVVEHVRNGLAFQLRGMRDDLGWSQAKMGQEVGKPQNVISRLEDPNYGRPNLQTLLEIASGLGVGLLVRFVPFSRLVREFEDVSPAELAAASISDEAEARALQEWAQQEQPLPRFSNVAVTVDPTFFVGATLRIEPAGPNTFRVAYPQGYSIELPDNVSVSLGGRVTTRADIERATGNSVVDIAAFRASRVAPHRSDEPPELPSQATGTRG
jgi:transcriptional regulator with XRE-family HTH domain